MENAANKPRLERIVESVDWEFMEDAYPFSVEYPREKPLSETEKELALDIFAKYYAKAIDETLSDTRWDCAIDAYREVIRQREGE